MTTVKMSEPEKEVRTLYVYDEIGLGGMTAKDFVYILSNIQEPEVHVRVNSPGGNVFEGLAMFTAIKNYKGKTVAYIEGLVAGMATIVVLAADEVKMKEDAVFIMTEPTAVFDETDKSQKEEASLLLNTIRKTLIDVYCGKSGMTPLRVGFMMQDKTCLTAKEALEAKLVDVIIP
jgi:ATP-dependent protease ClpP protease subunit